jgi:hypothetical protein
MYAIVPALDQGFQHALVISKEIARSRKDVNLMTSNINMTLAKLYVNFMSIIHFGFYARRVGRE